MRYEPVLVMTLAAELFLSAGCATKKYVRNTVDPVSNRVDQVANQTNQQGQTLDATRRDVERNEQNISATRETAQAADARAGDALNAAGQASAKADQANRNLGELRNEIANLDDYKPSASAVVSFGLNKYNLTAAAKQDLDRLAQNKDQWKRYFVAVEGYTDRTGSDAYNDALSRRRADKVVQYLVARYGIPIYRIHQIGMGKSEENAGRRKADPRNRRVDVIVYTADAAVASNAPATAQP